MGQFGTGFMSTFQLSMMVDVRSLLKDEGEPYRPFRICLDRSGATHEDISRAIFQALETLKVAARAQPLETADENAFNTEFRYHLDNDRSREIARIGVDDLRNTLAFIMLFSDRLGEAELLLREGGADNSLLFRRGEHTLIPNGLERQEILAGETVRTFFLLWKDGAALAAEWDQKQGFLPLNPNTPGCSSTSPWWARSISLSRWYSTACLCGPMSPAAASLWWSMSNPWTPGKTGS